jgi:hypothetical protein
MTRRRGSLGSIPGVYGYETTPWPNARTSGRKRWNDLIVNLLVCGES